MSRPTTPIAAAALCGCLCASVALAGEPPAPDAPKKAALSCKLVTLEAPAGGRLEVTGEQFGKSPLVKIAGKVARLIDRYEDTIAVQIPKKSTGGSVTVHVGGKQAVCGELRILGGE